MVNRAGSLFYLHSRAMEVKKGDELDNFFSSQAI